MAPTAKSSKLSNGGGMSLPLIDCDSLKQALDYIGSIAASHHFQTATSIISQNNELHAQIKSKATEIAEVRKELQDQEHRNHIAVHEVSASLERERASKQSIEVQNKSLQKLLEEKEREIKEAEKKNKSLDGHIKALQEKGLQAADRLTQSSKDFSLLQQKLKERDSGIHQLEQTESELNDALTSIKTRNEKLEKELSEATRKARSSQSELHALRSFGIREEVDQETVTDGFDKLWHDATVEISSILFMDLKEEVLKDSGKWGKLREQTRHLGVPYPIPMPASNSLAAKRMRLVVIIATLSRKIDKHIFHPNYLTPDSDHIRWALDKLAMTDAERESHCRSVMLAVDPNFQKESLNSKINVVVREISNLLWELLSDSQYGEFQASLQKTVENAAKIWRHIQSAPDKYETDFDPLQHGDNQWRLFEFPGVKEDQNQVDDQVLHNHSLAIFPQLSAVIQGRRHGLTYVIRLPQLHASCKAAEDEMVQSPSSPTISCLPATRARRPSMSTNRAHVNGKLLSEGKVNGGR